MTDVNLDNNNHTSTAREITQWITNNKITSHGNQRGENMGSLCAVHIAIIQ